MYGACDIMGLGFYSRIRSGKNTQDDAINDIYQKLKESIPNFNVSDVLENRIKNSAEQMTVTETYEEGGNELGTEATTVSEVHLQHKIRSNEPVKILPDDGGVDKADVTGINYVGDSFTSNGITFKVTKYLGSAKDFNIWVVVKGIFSIEYFIDAAKSKIAISNQTTLGVPNDGNFHVIQMQFEDAQPLITRVDSGATVVNHADTNGDPIRGNDWFTGEISITGEYKAIFYMINNTASDDGNVARQTDVLNGNYDLTNCGWGLTGSNSLFVHTRPPFRIT